MGDFILVYVTFPSREKALELSRHLIEKRLIACANIFPIESVYAWKGELCQDHEYALLAKTMDERFEEVKTEILSKHPYDIPCVIRMPAYPVEGFYGWVQDAVNLKE